MKDIHEKNKGKHDTADGLKSSNTPPKKNTFLKLLKYYCDIWYLGFCDSGGVVRLFILDHAITTRFSQ